MRFPKICVLSCLLVGSGFAADPAPVVLTYDKITLSDGRILKHVVVKSYDAKTGKLLLLAEGQAMNLPVALVPDPLGATLQAGAPKAGGSTTSTQERNVYAPVILPTGPGGSPQVVTHAAKSADQKIQSHLDAARSVARTQTMGRHLGGEVKKITIVSCDLEDPVPAEGWIDRYKIRGTITYDCLDATGAILRRDSTRFEATTEFPPNRSSASTLNYVELTESGAPRPAGPRLTPKQLADLNGPTHKGPTVVHLEDPLAAHKKAAMEKARSYYEASFATTGRAAPAMNYELGEPEPVSGWNGRWRTPGKVIFHNLDRGAKAYRDTTTTFEVETEATGDAAPQVVNFTQKA